MSSEPKPHQHRPQGLALSLERKALLEAIEAAGRGAERRSAIPILSCLLLAADGGRLALVGSNMDVEIRSETPAAVEIPGRVCVDAHLFAAAVRAAGQELRLELDGDRLRIRSSGGTASLATLPADEFPAFAWDGELGPIFELAGDSLQTAFRAVRGAISKEETRYYLNGVFVELGARLLLTATDGHQLRHLALDGAHDPGDRAMVGIVPRHVVDAAGDLPDKVTLQLRAGMVRLISGPVCITGRLIDGSYPDWRSVVPESRPDHWGAIVDRADFAAAVERVRWATDDKARPLKVAFMEGGLIRLSCSGHGGGAEAETELAGQEIVNPGEVGLNAGILASALAASPAKRLRIGGANAAAPWLLLDDDEPDARIVVMPLRV